MPKKRDETQSFDVRTLEDLDRIAEEVGPVGPRTGPSKRTKEKEEWYVILKFLRCVIPSGVLKVPFAIRHGVERDDEPDFVMTRLNSYEVVALVEVTRASDESDQKELVALERFGKLPTMLGEFGGRFAGGGACRPGLVWASDVVEAIKRKDGKVIFRDSPTARHLLVYPNSNASSLLSDEEDEGEAVDNLRAEVAKDPALPNLVNGCVVHVLGGYLVCVDALGEARLLAR